MSQIREDDTYFMNMLPYYTWHGSGTICPEHPRANHQRRTPPHEPHQSIHPTRYSPPVHPVCQVYPVLNFSRRHSGRQLRFAQRNHRDALLVQRDVPQQQFDRFNRKN